MQKKFFGILVILIIIVSFFSFLIVKDIFQNFGESKPNLVWSINLENFISDLVYNDYRVFIIDGVNVICLNKTNGDEIWRKNVGSSGTVSKLLLYEDRLFAGKRGGVVTSFNKYTGEELLQFQGPVSSSLGSKSVPQNFFIADGRLFVYQDGYAVYNVTSAELFYRSNGWTIELGDASVSAPESSFIFLYDYSRSTRVNPNNGEKIWSMNGKSSEPAVVSQDKVVFWNFNPDSIFDLGQFILCVDASSGDVLWRYNVSSLVFQPTIYNELVLFGAHDGYFYALNFSNGDLVWKTSAIEQNHAKIEEGQKLTPVVSPIQIDTNKDSAIWSFMFLEDILNGVVEYNIIEYTGTLCEIELANGQLLWTKPLIDNATISSGTLLRATPLGLTMLDNYAFLTVRSNFYIINTQKGNIFLEKKFEHNLLAPTVTNDMVFVAEELNLSAYQ
jgi:outer membrane protein assembly factor BamB